MCGGGGGSSFFIFYFRFWGAGDVIFFIIFLQHFTFSIFAPCPPKHRYLAGLRKNSSFAGGGEGGHSGGIFLVFGGRGWL